MSSTPLYNLSWSEYGSSLISAVQLLRCQNELVDVTLTAGGRTFVAHKVVLCAASPFLLELLKTTTCKHPIVMLAGVQASDLESLLEFIYRGEVSVDQNQLPSLLQAAQCLNIQGLAPLTPDQAPPVKTVLDISKSPSMEQIQAHQSPLQPGDELAPLRRKRKAKRSPKDEPQAAKWPKVYVHLDADPAAMSTSSQETWNVHHLMSPVETLPLLVQNTPQAAATSTSPKIRGASDQPGVCPLCGAMLRQARNLRRHLLTSCKYRILEGASLDPGRPLLNAAGHDDKDTDLSLQQRMDEVGLLQNSADQDSKESISCTELLPPNSINTIISMS